MNISIVIPVYNEGKNIRHCLDALIAQNYPKNHYEIIVVNDGSTDSTPDSIREKQKKAKNKNVVLKIVNLDKNKGRVEARIAGAKNAKYEDILFTDSRCLADENILNIIKKVGYQPIVGNPIIDHDRSVFDRFIHITRRKLYPSSYGKRFAPIFITEKNFNKIAKGTTVFFCKKRLFLKSQPSSTNSNVSDDTKLLLNILHKRRLLKHPEVKVHYLARNSLEKEIKHTYERGPRFVDYYFNPKRLYFWVFIFLPAFLLAGLLTIGVFSPFSLFYVLVFIMLFFLLSSLYLSENIKDFFIVLIFLPIFFFVFEFGIAKGLVLKILKMY